MCVWVYSSVHLVWEVIRESVWQHPNLQQRPSGLFFGIPQPWRRFILLMCFFPPIMVTSLSFSSSVVQQSSKKLSDFQMEINGPSKNDVLVFKKNELISVKVML